MSAAEFLGGLLFIVISLAIIYAVIMWKEKINKRKIKNNYDEEQDASRKGELNRAKEFNTGFFADKGREAVDGKSDAKKPDRIERGLLFQDAAPSSLGKDMPGRRKTSRSSGGIFKKLRR